VNYANQLIALVCLLGPVSALSQDTIPIPHISPMNQRELTEMADRAKSGLFRVHAISIPDGLFQPIPIEADGLAVWLKVGENPPALVTTYAYISAAQTVELLIGTEWVQAQVVSGRGRATACRQLAAGGHRLRSASYFGLNGTVGGGARHARGARASRHALVLYTSAFLAAKRLPGRLPPR
jgi:hypothetical protein